MVDPKCYLRFASVPSCYDTFCIQTVILNSMVRQVTTYQLTAEFRQATFSLGTLTATASIFVVVRRPMKSLHSPVFINAPYNFSICENLKPGSIARNAMIIVQEQDPLLSYVSGFDLDLLNTDLTPVSGSPFEITPNQDGQGLLVAAVRLSLNASLDYENITQRNF